MSFVERADTKLRAGSERENPREKGKLNPGAEDLTVEESLLFACFRTYSLPGAFLGNPREFDSLRGLPSFLNRTGNGPGPFPDTACGFCSRAAKFVIKRRFHASRFVIETNADGTSEHDGGG